MVPLLGSSTHGRKSCLRDKVQEMRPKLPRQEERCLMFPSEKFALDPVVEDFLNLDLGNCMGHF